MKCGFGDAILAGIVLLCTACSVPAQRGQPVMPPLEFCWGSVVVPDADASAHLCKTAEHQMVLFATSANGAWTSQQVPPLSVYYPPSGPNNSNSLFRIGATVYAFAPVSGGGHEALPLSIVNSASTGPSIVLQPSRPVSRKQFFDFYSGILITRSDDRVQSGFDYVIDHTLLADQRIMAANVQDSNLLLLTQDVRAPFALKLGILPIKDGTVDRRTGLQILPIAPDLLSIRNAIVTKGGQICLVLDRNLARETLGPSTPKSGAALLCSTPDGSFREVAASNRKMVLFYQREKDIVAAVTASEALVLDPASSQTGWQVFNHIAEIDAPSAHSFTFAPSQKQFEWLNLTDNETRLQRYDIR